MRSFARVSVLALALALAGVVTTLGQSADRIYTQAQAKAGLATYDRKCATCHDGGTMGPELWGDAFLKDWEPKDLAALFARIKETMPEDNPGSLTDEELLGVIAFVLQQNGFAAGEKAIESPATLAGVKFTGAR